LTLRTYYHTISGQLGALTENLTAVFCKYIQALLLAILLSGCETYRISSDVPDQLDSLRSQVIPGETSRPEVHERLGLPFTSSKHRDVEIYRVASGHEVYVDIALIPVWVETEEVIIYALVVYDDKNVVEAIDWNLYQQSPVEIIGPDFRSARLDVGGFIFFADKEGDGEQRKEILLAPVSETQDVLRTPPPQGKCAVQLFFSVGVGGYLDYFLDNKPIGDMPLVMSWAPSNTRVFSKVLIAEGEHTLTVTTSNKPSEFHRTFLCEPEDILYVYPQLKQIQTEPWGLLRIRWQYSGEIAINSEPLESHDGWRRLLFYNGKWLGED
jgi:outer membrane protein assembly factor BamE (lipoprotein component of BamABCDE complex)